MKKILPLFIIPLVAFFCKSDKKESTTPSTGSAQIAAAYITPDTADKTRKLEILLRVIQKTIKYDSAKKKDIIIIDTFWGFKKIVPMLDSLGNVKKDSSGRTFVNEAWFPIGKDSVNWRIEGIPVDSLLKKQQQ
jgi:hypothetical protein